MVQTFFGSTCINTTLKTLRHLVSRFPAHAGSVSVVSPERINNQFTQWMQHLPRVVPFYAVKSNPEPIVIEALSSKLLSFDCASIREVRDIQRVTCASKSIASIIYAHPLKSERDINFINTLGIRTTVVDSVEECDKLHSAGWKGSAFVRVAVGDSGSKMPFSVKFGASEEEVEKIARQSLIPLSGVSFHVGSGCEDVNQYRNAIQYSDTVILNILRKYGHQPNVLDIGGGFSANKEQFQVTASVIRKALEDVPRNRVVIGEPGRYFAQPSQDLFVKVIAKKPGPNGWRYVIDESLYGHFSCIAFDHQKPAWIRVPMNDDDRYRPNDNGILFGRTCDSLDVIARGSMEMLEVGDWLYFPLMGAYTSATASEFNGFPKPHVLQDIADELPDTDQAFELTKQFHSTYSLTYSNALPPIL
jgi:ornithine decarboxylase